MGLFKKRKPRRGAGGAVVPPLDPTVADDEVYDEVVAGVPFPAPVDTDEDDEGDGAGRLAGVG